jgi:hypothetical protein
VSNDLYQCRSSSRQLQANQTHLAAQIENITAFLANMSTKVSDIYFNTPKICLHFLATLQNGNSYFRLQ